jgi:hypothetical protein
MTDQELRELVRESIAKQLGGASAPAERKTPAHPSSGAIQIHASHGVYAIARDPDNGPCIIEPSVPCTHCNYCKSHGH